MSRYIKMMYNFLNQESLSFASYSWFSFISFCSRTYPCKATSNSAVSRYFSTISPTLSKFESIMSNIYLFNIWTFWLKFDSTWLNSIYGKTICRTWPTLSNVYGIFWYFGSVFEKCDALFSIFSNYTTTWFPSTFNAGSIILTNLVLFTWFNKNLKYGIGSPPSFDF